MSEYNPQYVPLVISCTGGACNGDRLLAREDRSGFTLGSVGRNVCTGDADLARAFFGSDRSDNRDFCCRGALVSTNGCHSGLDVPVLPRLVLDDSVGWATDERAVARVGDLDVLAVLGDLADLGDLGDRADLDVLGDLDGCVGRGETDPRDAPRDDPRDAPRDDARNDLLAMV